jgi:outer membrane protein OmpA-like peptidoglycan-associated protein
MKHTVIAFSAAAVLLSACADPSGNSNAPRTQNGAVIGGLIGGMIGASASDDKLVKGAVGAGIGAAIGGVIGQQLDKQAGDLRRDIGNDAVTIENTGSELRVTMPQDLLFSVDSATVRGDLQSDLRALANNLTEYPDTTVEITGHTDDTGSDAYNFDLSDRRAAAVGDVLTNSGVAFGRVRTFGAGESRPIASNATDAGRAQNRRVEIVIRPNA